MASVVVAFGLRGQSEIKAQVVLCSFGGTARDARILSAIPGRWGEAPQRAHGHGRNLVHDIARSVGARRRGPPHRTGG